MASANNSIVPFPRRPIRRHNYELAFLPAALEIAETPPSPVGRAVGATIIAIFCTFFMPPGGRCIHDTTAKMYVIKAGPGMIKSA